MKVVAVIPARYGSSRFEGKPLADIAGAPMIAWVYHRVMRSRRIAQVYIATDDDRIARACEEHGLSYIMTRGDHGTSTERLYEVAQKVDADLYLCVNGDEPLIDHALFEAIIPDEAPPADAASLTFPLMGDDELAAALATFGLALPDGGLAKPTPDGVRPIYEQLVCALSGVTR